MFGLTDVQSKTIKFIKSFTAKRGHCPSFDDIRVHLGLKSKAGIHRIVTELEDRGRIRRIRNKRRSLTVVDDPPPMSDALLKEVEAFGLSQGMDSAKAISVLIRFGLIYVEELAARIKRG